jgi:hypothetical protein
LAGAFELALRPLPHDLTGLIHDVVFQPADRARRHEVTTGPDLRSQSKYIQVLDYAVVCEQDVLQCVDESLDEVVDVLQALRPGDYSDNRHADGLVPPSLRGQGTEVQVRRDLLLIEAEVV